MTSTSSAAPPAFKTPEGEVRYREAYDAVLRAWPVPYQEFDFPTRLGTTPRLRSRHELAREPGLPCGTAARPPHAQRDRG
jgi:hypothetical protein